ncbi:MAG: cobyrinate a,c-diamide synthase [Ruminococcus sp.]|nr:cobyrinate a,c-diamide synthase [Ruminococcus sp.]
MKRIIIGGTGSGCGKTTITCAVLQALCQRGLTVSSFKCGPDYIDPMFHEKIIGARAHNLDSFFCDDDTLKFLLYDNGKNSDISVIEGVMGFYDGYCGRGSAFSVSEITRTPAVTVIDCKGMSDSLGAMVKGFLEYKKPNRIAGFIFNRLPGKLAGLAEKICGELGTEFLGYMPVNDFSVESRHLGLVTADEISDLKYKTEQLGNLAQKHIFIDRLTEISEKEFPVFTAPRIKKINCGFTPVIAAARDEAFCFEYAENISLLEKTGCKVKYFSPLRDKKLPDDSCGLILGGGYPELYARRLFQNKQMLEDICRKIKAGMPAIAECGGFIYLHESVEDNLGKEHRGAGIIPGKAFKTDKLQRFGYIKMTAENDNLLCKKGETIPAHEFHYWDSDSCGGDFTAHKSGGQSRKCVHANGNLYAGFPHLYFYSDIKTAENFVKKCIGYGVANG